MGFTVHGYYPLELENLSAKRKWNMKRALVLCKDF